MSHGSTVSIVTKLREIVVPFAVEIRDLPAPRPALRSKKNANFFIFFIKRFFIDYKYRTYSTILKHAV